MRTITSERLVLRPWDAGDADFLLDLEGRWEVVRYLGADPMIMTSRIGALVPASHTFEPSRPSFTDPRIDDKDMSGLPPEQDAIGRMRCC